MSSPLTVTGAERSLARVIPASAQLEGGGFLVHRPIPARGIDQIDPFLLIDELGPTDVEPGKAVGAPDHPHKGFEVITYTISGEWEHRDSHGNHGILGPGEAQYMVAGSGLVHSEMPTDDFQRTGGPRHGFQIWVNLARADKRTAPRYKDVKRETIPVVEPAPGVTARVLAGSVFGVDGPVRSVTPWTYVHATLAPDARIEQPVSAGWTATAYVFGGIGRTGARELRRGDYAVFADDGETIVLQNAGAEPLETLLLCARPVREPMVRYGPFVMNSVDEIREAFSDYQLGRFGEIKPALAD
ncbi:MAG TPA: pirin family protein [Candidatus Baltobacteraceae bacterium]|nr:pirin family protein [Candidatus Baltobacteraceae bacterium]